MNLLAFDTSVEPITAAVQHGSVRLHFSGAGGPQASRTLIPALLKLLEQAQLVLTDLDALVFGRGPGSFTGLRTACSVAQGLAMGAKLPVLPVDTLLALAQDARNACGAQTPERLITLLDARMQEVYAATFIWRNNAWHSMNITPNKGGGVNLLHARI
jgi:tRNA threonylcarbamoyladenosine biosynthesis protein TsaB